LLKENYERRKVFRGVGVKCSRRISFKCHLPAAYWEVDEHKKAESRGGETSTSQESEVKRKKEG